MDLPLLPPVAPMLARLSRTLPTGDYAYEPKWDGFRCVAFRDGDEVDLRSRHGRPFARYFPEICEAIRSLPDARIVLDGELVIASGDGYDFPALLMRLHPAASRVARLAQETPAAFVAFDVLACGAEDVRSVPFSRRRATLEAAVPEGGPVVLTPSTRDPEVAAGWLDAAPPGIDGVVARDLAAPYEEGRRSLVKVKRERTLDCVVAGLRVFEGAPLVASLLLGLWEPGGSLAHVGVTSSFRDDARRQLFTDLAPLRVEIEHHPWREGFLLEGGATGRLAGSAGRWTPDLALDWVPLRPELVAEVSYTHADGTRLRHPARFLRWRPDREPGSCTTEQLAPAA